MYDVSNLWTTLVGTDGHWFETYVKINSVSYQQSQFIEISVSGTVFGDEPTVGECLASEIAIKMFQPSETIPRMAKIIPYVRVCAGNQQSEWIPQGEYFIDTREVTRNDDGLPILTLHGYDAMMKAEADYPSTSHAWPCDDTDVVAEIAQTIGVSVDSRTNDIMTYAYQIGLPAGYSMRETLGNIAAMYGGNFIIGLDGKLLLITLGGIPEETNYLIDSGGSPITFGGDRILV